MNKSMNESINDKCVYRLALAIPGLLKQACCARVMLILKKIDNTLYHLSLHSFCSIVSELLFFFSTNFRHVGSFFQKVKNENLQIVMFDSLKEAS